MVAAAALDSADCDIILSPGEGRVLKWSAAILAVTAKVNFRGCGNLHEKQLRMAAYLFELCYELCLAPSANVSESPGFETVIGIFGGSKE